MDNSQSNAIFTNLQDGICTVDMRGIVQYVNPAACHIFDKDETEMLGNRIWDGVPYLPTNDELIQLFIDACTEKKSSHEAVVDYDRGEGKVRKLRVVISYVQEEGNEKLLLILTDLTELVKVNTEFARYVSEEIADIILHTEEGDRLGGRMQKLTILFSDLRGFTALSERVDPVALLKILNRYYTTMSELLEKHHGVLIDIFGDGMFCAFGAPKPIENHAEEAVLCAIDMQNAMTEINEWNQSQGYPLIEMGIGINTGDAVVGNVGGKNRRKFSAMGNVVNLGSRVESSSTGGQILISETTKQALNQEVGIISTDTIFPKGATATLTVYNVKSLGNLCLTNDTDEPLVELKKEKQIWFHTIEEKQLRREIHEGQLCALSTYAAEITSETKLEKGDNVAIDIGDNLYAKVTAISDSRYKIVFTSKPDEFGVWKDKCLQ